MTLITNPLDEHQRTMKEIEIKRRPGMPIFENPVYKIPSPENQKHEEIKQKAWELYLYHGAKIDIKLCWNSAKDFYNYAKEKEKGNDDNDR